MGRKVTWTAEREATIIALWHNQSVTFQEIRQRVGEPPEHALYRKATSLGLGPRRKGRARGKQRVNQIMKRKRTMPGSRSATQSALHGLKKIGQWGNKKFPLPKTPKEDLAIPVERRVKSLHNLKYGQCRWPVGHPGDKDFFYCADTAVTTRPYCAAHCARAYQPVVT